MGLRPRNASISLRELGLGMQRNTHLDADLTGITHDSRQVQPGDLFVAIPGFASHGIKFLDQALANGAVAVASDHIGVEQAQKLGMPTLLLEDPRGDMALASSYVYDHPQSKLPIVGVTGTNGKTTVTHVMKSLLQDAGLQVGMIGTLGSFLNDEPLPSVRTTPESTDLFALFAVMCERGADVIVMEVSSHALELGRVENVFFQVGIFTNLTQDHLDFHSDMQSYFAAKSKLFRPETCNHAVVCVDDVWGRTLADSVQVPLQTVSSTGQEANWQASSMASHLGRSQFTVTHNGHAFQECTINMLGDFNVTNALQAIVACELLGLPIEQLLKYARHIRPVPGRLEVVEIGSGVLGVVDYAHTPDAVEKVLGQLRKQSPERIITVIGCGGDRDSAKRPLMGRMAGQYSDIVIVTDDNPRSENPESIRSQVLAGVSDSMAIEVADRRQAIREALRLANDGDIIAVLGKGHESGQEVAGTVHPFSDVDVLREEAAHA